MALWWRWKETIIGGGGLMVTEGKCTGGKPNPTTLNMDKHAYCHCHPDRVTAINLLVAHYNQVLTYQTLPNFSGK